MRNRIACQECKRTGLGTRQQCQAAYRQSIEEWKTRLAEHKRQAAIIRGALKKLTREERRVLGL